MPENLLSTLALPGASDVARPVPPPERTSRSDTSWIGVDELHGGHSPRLDGLSTDHVHALTELEDDLPPILVQRSTMRVIDGMHRLEAARLLGRRRIPVQFFEGDDNEAFLLAVESNIRHGLPLSLGDRRAAAERIISSWPHGSDRWIGSITGLAAKTIASIRRSCDDGSGHALARLGRDGRLRPVNSRERRQVASELIARHPEASLRTIAKSAGISVGTARDVRDKIRRGVDPVLPKRAGGTEAGHGGAATRKPVLDPQPVLDRLRADPALRYSEAGRALLRWLQPSLAISRTDWRAMMPNIPAHNAFLIAEIARSCATIWSDFAEALDTITTDCAEDGTEQAGPDAVAAPVTRTVAPVRSVDPPAMIVRWTTPLVPSQRVAPPERHERQTVARRHA